MINLRFSKSTLVGAVGLTVFIYFFLAYSASAATITWTSAAASNWNTSSSWSTGAVPTGTDIALFSASSTASSTINANTSVGGIQITSGYTGTITQSSTYTITVGTQGYSQAGGTFAGGTGAINSTSTFSLTGGTFTSTQGTLTIASTTTFSPTVFQNNSGTVVWASTSTITGSSTFNGIQFGDGFQGANYNFTVASGTILTAQGTTTLWSYGSSITLLGGEVDAKGNVTPGASLGTLAAATGSTNLVLNGTGNQTVDGSSATLILPSLSINKPSGTATFLGTIFVTGGNWTNTTGTVSMGTSTIKIDSGPAVAVNGSSTFYNLSLGFDGYNHLPGSMDATITLATGTVLTVQNTLTLLVNNSVLTLNGGEIDAGGDVVPSYEGSANNGTGTTSIVLNGGGSQNINSSGHAAFGLPNVTINKSGGSVALGGKIYVRGNWTNQSGTAISPATSTVYFTAASSTLNGSSTFYDLTFGDTTGSFNNTFTIATGTVIAVQNLLRMGNNYNSITLNGGEIDVQGDVRVFYQGASGGGTTNIVLNGTGNQTLSGTGVTGGSFTLVLPNVVIQKSSGLVSHSSTVTVSGNLSLDQGELRLSSSTTSATLQVNSTTTVASGAILSNYATVSSTLKLGGSLVNNGTVFFDGGGGGCGSSDYVIIRSTSDGTQRNWSGSGLFILQDVDLKDQSSTIPINVYSSTNTGNNGSKFSFVSCPTLTQTDYCFYQNSANTINPISALATQSTIPTLTATSTPIRLLMNLIAGTSAFPTSTQAFKLQYAANGTSSWADAGATSSASTWIFYDNASLADQTTVTSTLLSTSNIGESYVESNSTATNTAGFAVGQGAEWDFALNPQNATSGNTYYFRMVKSSGTALDAYSTYSAITVNITASTPPTTTLGGGGGYSYDFKINGGATTTASNVVTLRINAVGASGIKTSNSPDFAGSRWLPYSSEYIWTLSPGSGTKTVYLDVNGPFIGTPPPISRTITLVSSTVAATVVTSTPSIRDLQAQLNSLIAILNNLIAQAKEQGIAVSLPNLPPLSSTPPVTIPTSDLELWDRGTDVQALQEFLIREETGPWAARLKAHGATTVFGLLTYHALVEFQASHNLPATGYFGRLTREKISALNGE